MHAHDHTNTPLGLGQISAHSAFLSALTLACILQMMAVQKHTQQESIVLEVNVIHDQKPRIGYDQEEGNVSRHKPQSPALMPICQLMVSSVVLH